MTFSPKNSTRLTQSSPTWGYLHILPSSKPNPPVYMCNDVNKTPEVEWLCFWATLDSWKWEKNAWFLDRVGRWKEKRAGTQMHPNGFTRQNKAESKGLEITKGQHWRHWRQRGTQRTLKSIWKEGGKEDLKLWKRNKNRKVYRENTRGKSFKQIFKTFHMKHANVC